MSSSLERKMAIIVSAQNYTLVPNPLANSESSNEPVHPHILVRFDHSLLTIKSVKAQTTYIRHLPH